MDSLSDSKSDDHATVQGYYSDNYVQSRAKQRQIQETEASVTLEYIEVEKGRQSSIITT
jgi:hypothetical protein